jgi:hypothetical protein
VMSDIELAQSLLWQSEAAIKRLADELSTVRARLATANQLLAARNDTR